MPLITMGNAAKNRHGFPRAGALGTLLLAAVIASSGYGERGAGAGVPARTLGSPVRLGQQAGAPPAQTQPDRTGGPDRVAEPGELQPEPATLHSLAVRWPVKGDANADAVIAVQYRASGEPAWREGFPLFRTHPSMVSPENRVPGGWLFAGSIVDLVPDTEYEVRLTLRDPDGGDAERTLVMRTIAEPREPAAMRVRHVVPGPAGGGGSGTREDPFRGLKAAQAAAAPGDLFLLHAGIYREAPWTIDRHGARGRPIIYRGAGDGEAILDGGGGERLVSAPGAQHVWLEDVTLRNARYLFVGHNGGHLVVRRSRFHVSQVGIAAINGGYDRSRGFVITDNVFTGPAVWPRARGIEEINTLSVTGAGHVVAYNLFTGVGDGVHGTSHGRLSASDFHNNDVDLCTDDAIEADYSDTNVRVFRNRITNCFAGVSAQPVHGGPLYVFRNAIYNVQYSPFKLHNDTAGVLLFHNTAVSQGLPFHIQPARETVNDVVTRNNLFIGGPGPALRSTGRMIRSDFDSDGYGWDGGPFALWNDRTYASPAAAKASGALYRTHGAVVVRPRGNFASGLERPTNFRVRYRPSDIDLRLDKASRAVDAGVEVPNFSEGFTGKAPDLGCCELGQPLPHYGPRPAAPR